VSDQLHHHRADQIIEQVLTPFGAEQALVAAMRQQAFDRREHQAGGDHVEREEVDAEKDAPVMRFVRLHVGATEQGRDERDHQRGDAECLARAEQHAEQGQRVTRDQGGVDDDAEAGPVAHRAQLRQREIFRPAHGEHEAQAGNGEDDREETGEPARTETTRLDRRLEITRQRCQEVTLHRFGPRRSASPYRSDGEHIVSRWQLIAAIRRLR
jgi:hypothetical protein